MEECEGGKGERGEVGLKQSTECWIEYRVRSSEYGGMRRQCKGANRSGAPVQRWKGELKLEYRVRSTDYGVQRTEYGKVAVRRCKSAWGLCKGGKGEANQSSECWIEYRVRRTEYGGTGA